ncbi:MAG: hypothetical protein K0Q95_2354 [Bacteroidota bacterium]|jgi:hypothetical protein|nr:hypothetical protein [Bacteroidota bacterium]
MEIPKDAKIIDWPTSVLWFDEYGILYSKPKPGAEQTVISREQTLRQMNEVKRLTGNKKLCMILETNSNSKPPQKEDRDFLSEQLSLITKAMAIISSSPLSRMIANLFFGLKPPEYPVKFFSNEKEAQAWIKQYL